MKPALTPVVVADEQGLALVADFLKRTDTFCLDTEWPVNDDFYTRKLRLIQVGDRTEQYLIDLLAFAGSPEGLAASQGNYGAAAELLLGKVIETLRPALEDHAKTKVGVNIQSDYEALNWCLGIRTTGFYDCFIAEKNIYAGLVHFMAKKFWAFEDLVRKYVGLELQDTETGKTFTMDKPLTEEQITYSALDVRLPIPVMNGQLRLIRAAGLDAAVQIDFDAISPFGDMHLSGIGLDDADWQALIDKNFGMKQRIIAKLDEFFIPVVGTKFVSAADVQRMSELEEAWQDCPQKTTEDKAKRKDLRLAFYAFRHHVNEKLKLADDCEGDAFVNYRSPKQLLAAFRKMGFGVKKLKDTSDKSFEKLAKFPELDVEKAFGKDGGTLDYPAIDLMRLYRSIGKLIDTYGKLWVTTRSQGGYKSNYTGRIHSYIDLLGAATGRSASKDPNIQNLPHDLAYRHCFKARPGYKIITVDYSGCELRILAFMSGEPIWLEAFEKGWDVHSVGAELLYGDRWKNAAVHEEYAVVKDGKTKIVKKCAYYYQDAKGRDHQKCDCPEHKTLRGHIKSVNFGLAYGLQAKGLADQLGITVEEAEELLTRYKAAFPTVMKFLDGLGESAKARLEARTVTGRRRRWAMPTWETAKAKVLKKLKKGETLTTEKIRKQYVGMFRSIEREGKNAPIQGGNSDLTKRAMFLIWQQLWLRFKAEFINMVHDEIVVECPEEHANECYEFIAQCMRAAGAEWIKGIVMDVEGAPEDKWTK